MQLKRIDFNWVLLVIALLLGMIAAWATKNYFIVKEQEIRAELSNSNVQMIDVVVATQDLRKGDIVSESNMSVRSIREDVLPLDVIHPSRFSEVAGQMLLNEMSPGRPLLSTYLPGFKAKQFSDLLSEGQRAVTIDIDEENSTAGMLVPSDVVDLYLSYKVGEQEASRGKLELLIEKAQVLATGKRSIDIHPELVESIYDNPDSYNTVTLALSVEDAVRVSLAKGKGKFVSLLRNKNETIPVRIKDMYSDQIFGVNSKSQFKQVEIITGGSGAKSSFQAYPLPEKIMAELAKESNKAAL